MIVTFRESYYIWYHIDSIFDESVAGSTPSGGTYYCPQVPPIFFEGKYTEKVMKVLKNKFESIVFSPEVPNDFKFEDNADEAAFLLWSSDGVEI